MKINCADVQTTAALLAVQKSNEPRQHSTTTLTGYTACAHNVTAFSAMVFQGSAAVHERSCTFTTVRPARLCAAAVYLVCALISTSLPLSTSWKPELSSFLPKSFVQNEMSSASVQSTLRLDRKSPGFSPADREAAVRLRWQQHHHGYRASAFPITDLTLIGAAASLRASEADETQRRTLQSRGWKVLTARAVFVFVDAVSGNDTHCAPCKTLSAAVDAAWSAAASSRWWAQPAVSFVPGQPALQAPRAYVIVRQSAAMDTDAFPADSLAVISSAIHSSAVLPHISFQCMPAAEFEHVHALYRFSASGSARSTGANIQCAHVARWLTASPTTGTLSAAQVNAVATLVNTGFSSGLRLQLSTITADAGAPASTAYVLSELYGWVGGAGARFIDTKYPDKAAQCGWAPAGSHGAAAFAASRPHTTLLPTTISPLDSPLHALQAAGLQLLQSVPFGVQQGAFSDACASSASYTLLYISLPLQFPSPQDATIMLGVPHELSGLVFLNPTQCSSGIIDGILLDASGDLAGFGPVLVSASPGLPFANSITIELAGFAFSSTAAVWNAWGNTSPLALQTLGLDSSAMGLVSPSPVTLSGAISMCASRVIIQGTSSTSSGGWLSASEGSGVALIQFDSFNTSSSGNGGFLSATSAATVVAGQGHISSSYAASDGGAISVEGGARFMTLGSLPRGSEAMQFAMNSSIAGGSGGAVSCQGGAACLLRRSTLHHCTASSGGCVAVHAGSLLRINSTVIQGGIASTSGGCIFVSGGSAVNDTQSHWSNCTAPQGGILSAALNSSAVILHGTKVTGLGASSGLIAPLSGGCLYLAVDVAAWIVGAEFEHCIAGSGGAIHAHSSVRLSLSNTAIQHSSCSDSACLGGAIWAHNSVQIFMLRSILHDCAAMVALGSGGCIASGTNTEVEIAHSSISSGAAFVSGGCLAATSDRTILKLFNVTTQNCRAGGIVQGLSSNGAGGCIFSAGGSVQLLGANRVEQCITMSASGRGGDGGGIAIISTSAPAPGSPVADFQPSLVVPACPVHCSGLSPGTACITAPPGNVTALTQWGVDGHPGDLNANIVRGSSAARGGGAYLVGVFLFVNGSQCFPWSAVNGDSVLPTQTSGKLLQVQSDGISPALLPMSRHACLWSPSLLGPACTDGSSAGFTSGFLAGPFALVLIGNSATNAGGGMLVGQDDIRSADSGESVLSALIANWLWVEENSSNYVGGGISAGPFALMRLQFARFAFNSAENGGGALLYMGLSHPANALHGLDVIRNTASQGGGISWASGFYTLGGNARHATELQAVDLDRPFISDLDEVSKNPPMNTPTYTAAQLEQDLAPYISSAYVDFIKNLVQGTRWTLPPGTPPQKPNFHIELATDGLSSRLVVIQNRGDSSGGGIAAFNRVQVRLVGARLAVASALETKLIALNMFPQVRKFEDSGKTTCDDTNPTWLFNDRVDYRAPAWWLALPKYGLVSWPRRWMEDWLPNNRLTHGLEPPTSQYRMRTERSQVSASSIASLVLSQVVNTFSWTSGALVGSASDFIGTPELFVPAILLPVATFIGNSAPFGGGADILCAEFTGCTVEGIVSSQANARLGGTINLSGDVFGRLGHSVATYATAGIQGGVAYSASRSNLSMATVASQCSRCGVQGCVAFSTSGQLKVSDSAFSDSASRGGAAGLYITGVDGHIPIVRSGRLQLERSTFSLMKGGSDGIGAIQYDASGTGWMKELAVYRSFTSGSNGGAALYCRGAAPGESVLAVSSMVSFWTGALPGAGGSILADDFCDLTVSNSTFGGSASQFGGGVLAVPGKSAQVALSGSINMHDCANSEMGAAISMSGHNSLLTVLSPDSMGGLAIENCKSALSGPGIALLSTTRMVIAADASVNIRNATSLGGGALTIAGVIDGNLVGDSPVLDLYGKLRFFDIESKHTSSLGVALLASSNALVNLHSGSELSCRKLQNAFSGSCIALDGPAVALSLSNATLSVNDCQAVQGPGIVLQNGALMKATDGSFVQAANNIATRNGGFASISGGSVVSDGAAWRIQHNQAGGAGGAIYVSASSGFPLSCDAGTDLCTEFFVAFNPADGAASFDCSLNSAEAGGCLFVEAIEQSGGEVSQVKLTLLEERTNSTGFTFQGNSARAAAGNTASGFGGAISLGRHVMANMSGVHAHNNTASNGGGAFAVVGSSTALHLSKSSLNANVVLLGSGGGGFVAGQGNTLSLHDVHVERNQATRMGGGLATVGDHDIRITQSIFSVNSLASARLSCDTEQCGGGGLACVGSSPSVHISNSSINFNTAALLPSSGGGILLSGAEHVAMESVTLIGNTAVAGTGGGLFAASVEQLVLSGTSVVRENSADVAAGVALQLTAAAVCLSAPQARDWSTSSLVAQLCSGSPAAWNLPQTHTACNIHIFNNTASVGAAGDGQGAVGGLLLDRSAVHAAKLAVNGNAAGSFAGLRITGFWPMGSQVAGQASIALVNSSIDGNRATCSRPGITCGPSGMQSSTEAVHVALVNTVAENNIADQVSNQLDCSARSCFVSQIGWPQYAGAIGQQTLHPLPNMCDSIPTTTYLVDKATNSRSQCCGSAFKPCHDIASAVRASVPGDEIRVAAGLYSGGGNENLTISSDTVIKSEYAALMIISVSLPALRRDDLQRGVSSAAGNSRVLAAAATSAASSGSHMMALLAFHCGPSSQLSDSASFWVDMAATVSLAGGVFVMREVFPFCGESAGLVAIGPDGEWADKQTVIKHTLGAGLFRLAGASAPYLRLEGLHLDTLSSSTAVTTSSLALLSCSGRQGAAFQASLYMKEVSAANMSFSSSHSPALLSSGGCAVTVLNSALTALRSSRLPVMRAMSYSTLSIEGSFFGALSSGADPVLLAEGGSVLDVNSSSFAANSAGRSSPLQIDESAAMISDTLFVSHAAGMDGGCLALSASSLHLRAERRNVSMLQNTAKGFGGAMHLSRGATVKATSLDGHFVTIRRNTAKSGGAAALLGESHATLTGQVQVSENTAEQYGGAFYAEKSELNMQCGHSMPMGGTCLQPHLDSNLAQIDGGGIFALLSAINVNGTSFTRNTAVRGGGIACILSSVYAERSVFQNNTADADGAALDLRTGDSLRMESCRVSHNAAAGDGGAVSANAPQVLSLSSSHFFGNSARSGRGGAVFLTASRISNMSVSRGSSFVGNAAGTLGGALFIENTEGVPSGCASAAALSSLLGAAAGVSLLRATTQADGAINVHLLTAHGEVKSYEVTEAAAVATWGRLLGDCPALVTGAAQGTVLGAGSPQLAAPWGAALLTVSFLHSSVFHHNHASDKGGAVYASGARLGFAGPLSLRGNAAQTRGGGIYLAQGGLADILPGSDHSNAHILEDNMAGTSGAAVFADASSSSLIVGANVSHNCVPATLPVNTESDTGSAAVPAWLVRLQGRCSSSKRSLQLVNAGNMLPRDSFSEADGDFAEVQPGGAIAAAGTSNSLIAVWLINSTVHSNIGGGGLAAVLSSSSLGKLPAWAAAAQPVAGGGALQQAALHPMLGGMDVRTSNLSNNAAVTQLLPLLHEAEVRALMGGLPGTHGLPASTGRGLTGLQAANQMAADGGFVLLRNLVLTGGVAGPSGGGDVLPAALAQGPSTALSLGSTAAHATQVSVHSITPSLCASMFGSLQEQAAVVARVCAPAGNDTGAHAACLHPGAPIPAQLGTSLVFVDANGNQAFGDSIPASVRVGVTLPCPPTGSILRPGANLASASPLHVSRATGLMSLTGLVLLSVTPYWALIAVTASADTGALHSAELRLPMAPCPAGTGWSQGDCAPCVAGQVSTALEYSCHSCSGNQVPATTADGGVSSSLCSPCPAGQVPDQTRPGLCARCLPGTQPTADGSACESCAAGAASPLGEVCMTCRPGQFAAGRGSVACSACASGLYSLPLVQRVPSLATSMQQWEMSGATGCTSCASLAATCEQGSLRLRDNLYMAVLTGSAALQPDVLVCRQGSLLSRLPPQNGSRPSYATGACGMDADCVAFQLQALQAVAFGSKDMHLCIGDGACEPLSGAQFVGTSNTSAVAPDGAAGDTLGIRCGEGREGPLCAACSPSGGEGEGYVRTGDRCAACSTGDMQVFLLVLVTVALVLLLSYAALFLRSSDENNEHQVLFKIFINHLQVLATQTSVALTAQLSALAQVWGDVGEVSGGGVFSLSPMRCYFKQQWAALHSMQLLSPFIMLLYVALLQIMFVRCGLSRFAVEREEKLSQHTDTSGALVSTQENPFLQPQQPSVAPKAPPTPPTPSSGSKAARRRSVMAVRRGGDLVAVRQYLCGAQIPLRLQSWDELWQQRGIIAPLVFVALVTYNSLLQSGLVALRCTNEVQGGHWLLADTSVPCSGPVYGVLSAMSGLAVAVVALAMPVAGVLLLIPHRKHLSTPRIFQRYGMLYGGYRSSRWYWESIIMLRKVAVQIIASLLTVTGLRLVALLLVMGLCVLAQAKLKPYKQHALNRLEMLSLGSLLLSLVLEVAVLAASGVSNNAAALDASLQTLQNAQVPIAVTIIVIQLLVVGTLMVFLVRATLQQLKDAVLAKGGCSSHKPKASSKVSLAVELATKRSNTTAHQHRMAAQRMAALDAIAESSPPPSLAEAKGGFPGAPPRKVKATYLAVQHSNPLHSAPSPSQSPVTSADGKSAGQQPPPGGTGVTLQDRRASRIRSMKFSQATNTRK